MEERLQYYMDHTISMDDPVDFTCKMCGSCCRKRSEPIIMTGTDIFFIGKALNEEPAEVFSKYLDCYIGHRSNVPVCVLTERDDGSCKLLRNSKCIVQSSKPAVCAIYPLGRMVVAGDDHYTYFMQPNSCPGVEGGPTKTLREWLAEFNLQERDKYHLEWQNLLMAASQYMINHKKMNPKQMEIYQRAILVALYLNYPLEREYLESIKENRKLLQTVITDFEIRD